MVLVTTGDLLGAAELWRFVLDEFAPVRDTTMSRIDPGGFIVRHVDAGPYRERWHVPVIAGDLSGTRAEDGVPFTVDHWEPHSVTNDTDRPRVHIVIDRDVLIDVPSKPFAVLEEKPHG